MPTTDASEKGLETLIVEPLTGDAGYAPRQQRPVQPFGAPKPRRTHIFRVARQPRCGKRRSGRVDIGMAGWAELGHGTTGLGDHDLPARLRPLRPQPSPMNEYPTP